MLSRVFSSKYIFIYLFALGVTALLSACGGGGGGGGSSLADAVQYTGIENQAILNPLDEADTTALSVDLAMVEAEVTKSDYANPFGVSISQSVTTTDKNKVRTVLSEFIKQNI